MKTMMKTMELKEIVEKVNACHPGSWHTIIYKGSPIKITSDKQVVPVKRMIVRFKISYGNMPSVKVDNLIISASNEEQVNTCIAEYNSLSKQQKACVAHYEELIAKSEACDKGETIIIAEKKQSSAREHDNDYPFIVNCKNGNKLLTCFNPYLNSKVKKTYFTLCDGEYRPSTEEEIVLAIANTKHSSGASPTYGIGVNNIISIK